MMAMNDERQSASGAIFCSPFCAHPSSLVVLFLRDDDHFPAFVETALGAHPVGQTRFLTVRTQRSLRGTQRIVRAPFAGSRLRVAAFRIRHDKSSSILKFKVQGSKFEAKKPAANFEP
jgi:hypothetical protein